MPLLHGGYIHDGQYARIHGHKGICSESEWGPIARDLELAAKTGCKYHVCHISTKESVELIRQAKKSGVDVTCETGPHYLVLDDSCLREDGRFKMNPPLRDRSDREALVEGLRDGTIDMIATDHAPHSAEEKARGLAKSAMGVVGIETAFPVVYTYLVKPGLVPLETVVNALTVNPRTRFGLPLGEDFSVWDLEDRYSHRPRDLPEPGPGHALRGHGGPGTKSAHRLRRQGRLAGRKELRCSSSSAASWKTRPSPTRCGGCASRPIPPPSPLPVSL